MTQVTKQCLSDLKDNQIRSKEGYEDEGDDDSQAGNHCFAKSIPLTDVSG